jgi:hypothetical protein
VHDIQPGDPLPDGLTGFLSATPFSYTVTAAPSVEPAAVEFHVAGAIGGVAVQGYIDVLDVHGDVTDVKTASK